jgi:N-carbamoylputrescine amidase
MIQKHERYVHEAAAQGAQVMLFQELFYGPYFCQVQDRQYYSYTERIPDGPTTKRMQDLAKEVGMVLVVPMYEEDSQTSGIYYNTAAVIDSDGTFLGKYRKTHIPHVTGFWEKFYFPSSRRRWARSASTSATTVTSRRARALSASTAPRSC